MIKINSDKRAVTITIDRTLTTPELLLLIHSLIQTRAKMSPAVPVDHKLLAIDESPDFIELDDPNFTAARHNDGRIRFWVRNAGLGWTAFNISTDRACALRDYLIANTPPTPSAINLIEPPASGNTTH